MQQAVAGQLLAAQLGEGVELGQFGDEQVAALWGERFAGLFAGLQRIVDFLGARLVAADLGLGALGASLRGDDQAVGLADLLLPVTQLVAALIEQRFQLGHRGLGVPLSDLRRLAGFQAGEFALGFVDQFWGLFELLFEIAQAFLAVGLLGQQTQGFFQGLPDCQLLGFRQLAFG